MREEEAVSGPDPESTYRLVVVLGSECFTAILGYDEAIAFCKLLDGSGIYWESHEVDETENLCARSESGTDDVFNIAVERGWIHVHQSHAAARVVPRPHLRGPRHRGH